jgi:hypothetical protein
MLLKLKYINICYNNTKVLTQHVKTNEFAKRHPISFMISKNMIT